jgi:hypothetical protein
MTNKPKIDDVGTIIDIDMQEDISIAVEHSDESGLGLVIKVQKPDGSVVETWQDCTVYDTTHLRYTTVADDLDVGGTYLLVPKFALGVWEGEGDTVTMYVYEEFELE